MKALTKTIIVLFVLFMFLFTIRGALAAHDCTLYGNYYECTNGNTISGTNNFGDKGVWIHGMSISISGTNGQAGNVNGEDASFCISSDFKILIENTSISVSGGNGYSEEGVTGGNGGDVLITFSGDGLMLINNTNLTVTGGVGANGDALPVSGDDDSGFYGGYGGTFSLEFDTMNVTGENVRVVATAGLTGESDVTCSGTGAVQRSGRSSQTNYLKIGSTCYDGTNSFFLTGGNGGNGDACGDNRAAEGGDGGDVEVIVQTHNFVSSDNFSLVGGMFGLKRVNDDDAADGVNGIGSFILDSNNAVFSGTLSFVGKQAAGNCDDGGAGTDLCTAQDQKSITNYFNSTSLILNGSTIYFSGNHGQDGDANDGAIGGDASHITMYLISDDLVMESTQIDFVGATGGDGDNDWSGRNDGTGSDIKFYVKGIFEGKNNKISLISGDSGDYATAGNAGAGNIVITFVNKTVLESDEWVFSIGDEDSSNPTSRGGLNANYESLELISTILNHNNPNSGQNVLVNFSTSLLLNDSIIYARHKGASCLPTISYFNNIKLLETKDSLINLYSAEACKTYLYGSGEEFNFLNNTKVNLSSATGQGYLNITLSSNRAGLPGLVRWNYTELGSVITANVISEQTSYNSSRGSLTETGTWTWNHSVNDVVYDDYFTRIKSVGFQKVSSDLGSDLYNYTNFTCKAKVGIGSFLTGTPKINFTIYNETSKQASSNDVGIVSDEFVNATFQINGSNTKISETWNCSVKVYETTFENGNSTLKNVNYTFPYNVSVWVGQMKKVAGSIPNAYLLDDVNVTLDRGTINEYIQKNCTSSPCLVPIEFRSSTDAIINITSLNVTYGIRNPINPNVTDSYNFPIIFNSSREGQLIIEDAYFVYKDSEETDIRVDGRTSIETVTKWVSVLYSKFSFNLTPSFVDYYDVYPLWLSQKDVTPYGQTSSRSIYNLTRMNNANHTFELRMKMENGTGASCTDIWFSTDNSKSGGFEVVEGNYTYFKNVTWDDVNSTELWSWVDFNDCNSTSVRYFFPEFVIKSKANGTVNAVNFWSD